MNRGSPTPDFRPRTPYATTDTVYSWIVEPTVPVLNRGPLWTFRASEG